VISAVFLENSSFAVRYTSTQEAAAIQDADVFANVPTRAKVTGTFSIQHRNEKKAYRGVISIGVTIGKRRRYDH
jgi:hypothetical protein